MTPAPAEATIREDARRIRGDATIHEAGAP